LLDKLTTKTRELKLENKTRKALQALKNQKKIETKNHKNQKLKQKIETKKFETKKTREKRENARKARKCKLWLQVLDASFIREL